MPNYRRICIDGGCWFFTVNLENRRSRLLTEHIGALFENMLSEQGQASGYGEREPEARRSDQAKP